MSERETTIRTAVLAYFPMFIATLSLLTSVYNGYLNNKFVSIIQGNLSKGEYMRTCKEIIDAYFQVKFKTGLIAQGNAPSPLQQSDAANAVSHFAALGTYLANLRDDAKRVRYTELSRELERIIKEAPRTAPDQLEKLFEPADRLFGEMNDDCVKSAKAAP
jgi:5'-deoxynucleotidase YfbR-like HD superfamily hydrolase